MAKKTLTEIVEAKVEELCTSGTLFSAHDVTTAVRASTVNLDVRQGTINLPAVWNGAVGKKVYEILHDDVKGIIDNLVNVGVLAASSGPTGGYRVFTRGCLLTNRAALVYVFAHALEYTGIPIIFSDLMKDIDSNITYADFCVKYELDDSLEIGTFFGELDDMLNTTIDDGEIIHCVTINDLFSVIVDDDHLNLKLLDRCDARLLQTVQPLVQYYTNGVTPAPPSQQVINQTATSDSVVQYLQRVGTRRGRKVTKTIKNVQSALKVSGLICNQILQHVNKDRRLKIVNASSNPSKVEIQLA